MKKIKTILLIFFVSIYLNGCMLMPRVYDESKFYENRGIIGTNYILSKDFKLAKGKNREIISRKYPEYFLLNFQNKSSYKIEYKIIDDLPKGTIIKIEKEYVYAENYFANGKSWTCGKIINEGKYKNIILRIADLFVVKNNIRYYEIDPLYAIEATPENIARIEKEIEEEKIKGK